MTQSVNAGNLGIQITSSAELAIKAVRSLTSSLKTATKATQGLTNAFKTLDTVSMSLNRATSSMSKMADSTKQSASSIKEFNAETNKSVSNAKESTKALQTMAGTFNNLKSSFLYSVGFGSVYQGLSTLTNLMKSGFQEASNFVENYNLFNVSFAGETEEAIKYQTELNNAFKVNMSESMRYQGFFKNLTSSLGITNEASTLLSENLTNLTYDLSSLYNTSFSAMYSKLQSGIVGQTKPLRSVGIDVTQQTLQPLLYDMGINKYVTELTQAEKVLLRYISILKQSTSAQGDFARTIETPANQIRIFSDQIAELTRWFGTLFIGTIGKVLPYINAFIITLKEVFKWVSLAFGFKVEDYDFISGDNGLGDIEEGLNDATDASEKLRKSLMGFDEINNISESTDGNIAFNTGGLSETYFQLLEQLEGYDNLMGNVQTKAGEISKSFLEWLGYTTDANGNITGIEGGLAKIAELSFIEIKDFFTNAKTFVTDVAQWFNDHPQAFEVLTNLIINGSLIAGALWLINNPLALILAAAVYFIANYDKIKEWWNALTPEEQLIGSLGLVAAGLMGVAFAAAAAWAGITSGVSVAPFLIGLGAISAAAAAIGLIGFSTIDFEKLGTTGGLVTEIGSQRPDYNAYGTYGTSSNAIGGISGSSMVSDSNDEQVVQLNVDGETFGRAVIKTSNKVRQNTNLDFNY